jgi:hypothetical protein
LEVYDILVYAVEDPLLELWPHGILEETDETAVEFGWHGGRTGADAAGVEGVGGGDGACSTRLIGWEG